MNAMAGMTNEKLHEGLQRFSGVLTEKDISQILTIQEQPLPTGIRINRLKAEPAEAIEALSARYCWQVKPLSFCDNGWVITQADASPGTTIEHRLGQYYLQDAASMVPVSLFDLHPPHPLTLDMAASPGGKTTHLIDRSLDKGFILANDASRSRIPALRSVLSTWSGINLAVTNYPGEAFGNWYPETFDLVLLDAPCSMENFRPTPNHPYRETTVDERSRLQERQIQLLTSGLQCLKVGGQLVYATCSLAPEENEAVVDALLHAYSDAIKIVNVAENFEFKAPGLTGFAGQAFNPDLVNTLRLWPHLTGMSGFFCALIIKTSHIPTQSESPPIRDFSRTDLEKTSENIQRDVIEQIATNFGMDLKGILLDYDLELYKRHDQLFLIPGHYLRHFITLPYEYIGLPLGRWVGNSLEPSHEFISRFGRQFAKGIIQIREAEVPQWIAGRDIRHPETDLTPKGQYLLVTDRQGRNLGMGKLLPKRLRNMLLRQSV